MTVYLLWDYGALVGVYADPETVHADRQHLLADARERLPGRTDDEYERRIAVDEVTPRTEPRYAAGVPRLSAEDQAFVDEHGGVEPRHHD